MEILLVTSMYLRQNLILAPYAGFHPGWRLYGCPVGFGHHEMWLTPADFVPWPCVHYLGGARLLPCVNWEKFMPAVFKKLQPFVVSLDESPPQLRPSAQ